jgi:hypothetical protein
VFDSLSLTQTFMVRVPVSAPTVTGPTTSFARFRVSTAGSPLPTGLALDGEVEDYRISIVPGIPPTGVDDSYTMNEDQVDGLIADDDINSDGFPNNDGVLANDIYPDLKLLTATIVTPPANAKSFNFSSNGTFTYVPNDDFFGTDTFVYLVSDGVLDSLTLATATITVRPVNDAPIAGPLQFAIDEDVELTIDQQQIFAVSAPGPANESGQSMTIIEVDPISANNGTVRFSNGKITYQPSVDFAGVDTFTYRIIDNGVTGVIPDPLEAIGTITITVREKNDVPTTTSKRLQTNEDTSVSISITNLISGDLVGPPDEQATQTLFFNGVAATSAQGGTVTVVGNRVFYTPPKDYNGVDTFTYTVIDDGTSGGVFDPQIGTGTVTVTVFPVNDAPIVTAPFGTITMLEDAAERALPLSSYFFDADVAFNGDVLTYKVISNTNPDLIEPSFGNGNIFLKPKADQNGTATIVVEAMDAAGLTVTNTLRVVVTPVADDPRLVTPLPDRTTSEDSLPITFDLSPTFFFDPDVINGDTLVFTASSSNTDVATVRIVGNKLELTMVPNASGQTTIFVTATDSTNRFVSDSFLLTVTPVNDAPVTMADSYTTPQGVALVTTDARGTLTISTNDNGVLANDRDPEGDNFTSTLVKATTKGTVTLNADGTFTYIPGSTALFGTTDSFTYIARDAFGAASPETTVTITIGRPPRPAYQNPNLNQDVNADGFVSPIDVLVLVNLLNSRGPSIPVAGLPGPPDYVDVDGDNFVTPLDALSVINYINAGGTGSGPGGEGEGEGNWLVGSEEDSQSQGWSVDVGREVVNNLLAMPSTTPSSADLGTNFTSSQWMFSSLVGSVGPLNGANGRSNADAANPLLGALFDVIGEKDELDRITDDLLLEAVADNQSLVDQALADLFSE